MSLDLVETIAAKAAMLPLEQQQKALEYIESLSAQEQDDENDPQPFFSVYGIIPRKIENLEQDLAEVRREMWQNFPRDFPREEPK